LSTEGFNPLNFHIEKIVIILNILVNIIFALQPIESENGAAKNNKFQAIKLIIKSVKLASLILKYKAQRLTIKLYQIRVYGVSELPQVRIGFKYANINENKSRVFDL